MTQMINVSQAHGWYVCVTSFYNGLKELNDKEHKFKTILFKLFFLFSLHGIETNCGDFLIDSLLNQNHIQLIKNSISSLLKEIRPVAVNLVDSFDFSDYYLNSALGVRDGNVYQKMLELQKNDPLNQTDVHSSYNIFSHLIKSNLWKDQKKKSLQNRSI